MTLAKGSDSQSLLRDWLKWSPNPYKNLDFALRGPPNKWSAHRKSLGTIGLGPRQVLRRLCCQCKGIGGIACEQYSQF